MFDKPFAYQDSFLGFGFISSSAVYKVQVVDPEYGVRDYKNYSNRDVNVLDLDAYIKTQ